MLKERNIQQSEVKNIVEDPQVLEFVSVHFVDVSRRSQLKRREMLNEFQQVIEVLTKAEKEFT